MYLPHRWGVTHITKRLELFNPDYLQINSSKDDLWKVESWLQLANQWGLNPSGCLKKLWLQMNWLLSWSFCHLEASVWASWFTGWRLMPQARALNAKQGHLASRGCSLTSTISEISACYLRTERWLALSLVLSSVCHHQTPNITISSIHIRSPRYDNERWLGEISLLKITGAFLSISRHP